MGKFSCKDKNIIECYIGRRGFMLFSTTLFCSLLVATLVSTLYGNQQSNNKIIAAYIRYRIAKKW